MQVHGFHYCETHKSYHTSKIYKNNNINDKYIKTINNHCCTCSNENVLSLQYV
jgi:hypothetical protein